VIRVVPNISLVWQFDFDPTTAGGVAAAQYAFGVRTDVPSLWYHIGVSPTDWILLGTGAAPAPQAQVFQYTVTGAEPDLSELTISIPTATANTSYGVVFTTQGAVRTLVGDINTKTTTTFRLSLTGDASAGDVLTFYLSPLT
jgi:hypothetical protein